MDPQGKHTVLIHSSYRSNVFRCSGPEVQANCSKLLSYRCDKTSPTKALGEARVNLVNTLGSQPTMKGSWSSLEAGTDTEPYRNTAHWIDCSACFLTVGRTTCPGAALPEKAGPFTLRKRLTDLPTSCLMEEFYHLRFLRSPDSCSLCQADKNLASTHTLTFMTQYGKKLPH